MTAVLCTFFVVATGLVVGWRPEGSAASTVAGFAIFLFFSYALSWGCACLGIVSKGPESAQGVGLVILFPLAIVSNALVPTARMPAALRVIADWNPVSAVTSAARQLFGNPNPSGSRSMPGRCSTPLSASLLWSVGAAGRVRSPGRLPVSPADDWVSPGPAASQTPPGPPATNRPAGRPKRPGTTQPAGRPNRPATTRPAGRPNRRVDKWRSLPHTQPIG